MTEKEKSDVIKAAIIASVGTVGIGAVAKHFRAKKAKRKLSDTERNRNTIIVPVKKSKFLEGLPTPSELAESRGEASSPVTAQLAAEAPMLMLPSPKPHEDMTPDEIAAKKKEILASNSRRFDFFGKSASIKKAGCEKRADFWEVIKSSLGTVFNPIDSGKQIWHSATGKPVWVAAGTIGGILLAGKLADMINERRRKKSEDAIESARGEYVNLLEGNEKSAQDVRDMVGLGAGYAFFIPLALSALVTNKILENRKIDKKREKEMSDSYPDDPIILYKTSEDKEIPLTASETLALIDISCAMMKYAEAYEAEDGLCKTAQSKEDLQPYVDMFRRELGDPANSADAVALLEAYQNNDNGAVSSTIENLLNRYMIRQGIDEEQVKALRGTDNQVKWDRLSSLDWKTQQRLVPLAMLYLNKDNKEVMKRLAYQIATDKGVRGDIASKFKTDENFINLKNRIVNKRMDDYIGNMWGGNFGKTFKKDGFFGKIAWWLARKIGSLWANSSWDEGLTNYMDSFAAKYAPKTEQDQLSNDVTPVDRDSAGNPQSGGTAPVNPQQPQTSASTAQTSSGRNTFGRYGLRTNV